MIFYLLPWASSIPPGGTFKYPKIRNADLDSVMTCSLIILFTIFCPVIELDVIVNYIVIITVRSILSKLDCFSHTGLQWLPKYWHWPHQAHCCSRPRSCDNLHIRRLDSYSIQGTVSLVSRGLLLQKDLGRLPYWIWSTRF